VLGHVYPAVRAVPALVATARPLLQVVCCEHCVAGLGVDVLITSGREGSLQQHQEQQQQQRHVNHNVLIKHCCVTSSSKLFCRSTHSIGWTSTCCSLKSL